MKKCPATNLTATGIIMLVNPNISQPLRISLYPLFIAFALEDMQKQVNAILHLDEDSSGKSNPVKNALLKTDKPSSNSLTVCPECGEETLIFEGGCVSCPSCGWTKCE